MKTLLVPIDFTQTSNNAVDFAVDWSKKFEYKRIILLKTFYDTLFDDVVMSSEYGVGMDFRLKEREEAELMLKQLSYDVSVKNTNIEVLAVTSELPLMRAIHEVVREENPETIIVGSDTNHYDNDSYVADHVIQIAKSCPVKTLIVPSTYKYKPVKEILIPVDSFVIPSIDKIKLLNTPGYLTDVDFKVLSIANIQIKINEQESERQLHGYLENIPHHVFFSQNKSAVDAIMEFLKTHHVQLIIALPGKYSFLYRLTHKTISEAICRNHKKPVLILK